ncbi:MAG: hypothetical protein H6719_28780 [Sandaracinaceae bacterium]|nr:hypothetical protein [Sandaracinaceae bacterium]
MFQATLRQHYALEEVDLLVLEETYVGDIGPGDELAVELPDGARATFTIHDLAWGSAMSATNPPLTLIVKGLDGAHPAPGAVIATPL